MSTLEDFKKYCLKWRNHVVFGELSEKELKFLLIDIKNLYNDLVNYDIIREHKIRSILVSKNMYNDNLTSLINKYLKSSNKQLEMEITLHTVFWLNY